MILEQLNRINTDLLAMNYSLQDIDVFWNECIKIAKQKQQIFTHDFKTSVNGKRLADKLNKLFGLDLEPKIKRFIKNDIKFLMIDKQGKVYEFKGIVLDFLSSDVAIELERRTFNIK